MDGDLTIINKHGIVHTIPARLLAQVLAAGGRVVEDAPAPVAETPTPVKATRKKAAK